MPEPEPDRSEPPAQDDAWLLDRCAAGDEEAWRELVRRYQRLVHAVPRRLGLPPELADDVFQEVFSILLRSVGRIERAEALPKWFVTTARRVSLRSARRHRRERPLPAGLEAAAAQAGELERLERSDQVWRAMDRLGERCRALLLALVRPGRPSYEAISRELTIPMGSIGPTRARCLAKLLRLMGEDPEAPGPSRMRAGENPVSTGARRGPQGNA